MDLNTNYHIPYLAKNSYIYGNPASSQILPKENAVPSEETNEEVLISSIKHPILCCQEDRKDLPPRSVLENLGANSCVKVKEKEYSNEFQKDPPRKWAEPIRIQNSRFNDFESRSNSCSSAVPTVIQNYLPNEVKILPTTFLNEPASAAEKFKDFRSKDYEVTKSQNQKVSETSLLDGFRNIENSYKRPVYYPDTCQAQPIYKPVASSVVSYEPDGSKSYLINRSRESDENEPYSYESSVLAERNNSRFEERDRSQYSSCKKYKRIDYNEENYRNTTGKKENLYDWKWDSQEKVSRSTLYSYKEDMENKKNKEIIENREKAYTRPTRDVWLEQSKKTNKYVSERPKIEMMKLDKSSRSLSNNPKSSANKSKLMITKKDLENKGNFIKDKNAKEKELFVSVMMKVLKTHAKNCPGLRKEINAIKLNKLYNYT